MFERPGRSAGTRAKYGPGPTWTSSVRLADVRCHLDSGQGRRPLPELGCATSKDLPQHVPKFPDHFQVNGIRGRQIPSMLRTLLGEANQSVLRGHIGAFEW